VASAGEDGGEAPAPPADHRHIVIDVTSDAFRPTLATLLDQEPEIRTVIHCAGVGSGFDPNDFSGELRCFRTNLHSVVELCAEVIPRWRSAGGGHLVVLSSLADGFVAPGSPSYVASKIALSRYLRGLGLRLRRDGISVTNVRFGFVDTKMAKARWKPLQWTTERAARTVLQVLRRPVPVRSRPRTIALLCLAGEWLQRLLLGLEALLPGRRSPRGRPGGPRNPDSS
jgi:NAD(P)-dependent dehydrogenase (short-subunit alcohol dehydrogenase family)